MTVNLEVTNRESLLAHLAANDCDMVIIGVPPREQDFVAEPLMENPLVVIASLHHDCPSIWDNPPSDHRGAAAACRWHPWALSP